MTPTAQYQRDARWDQSRICFNDGQVSAWVDRDGTAHLPPVDVSRLGPNGRAQLSAAALIKSPSFASDDVALFRAKMEAAVAVRFEYEDEQTMDHVQVRDDYVTSMRLTPDQSRAFYRDLNAKEDCRDFRIQAAIITASAIVGGVVYALGMAVWNAWVGK